jgi:alpha-L-arabinofuranosidase
MRDGEALSVHLSGNIPHFTSSSGPLNPKWIETLHPKESLSYLDASAVLCQGRSVRLAVVNRHRTLALSATLNLCGFKAPEKVVRFEVWSEDVAATNTWENGDEVQLTSATVDWEDAFTFKEHSFTLLKFDVSPSN